MTTQAFSTPEDVRRLRSEFRGLRPSITGNILPTLALGAAFGVLSGNMMASTESGLALSSAGYGLTTAMYGLQDAIAEVVLPLAEEVIPHIESAVRWFTDLNEETDGLAAKFGLLGLAAITLGPRLARLIPILLRLSPLLGGAAAVIADIPNIQQDIEDDRSLSQVITRTIGRAGGSAVAGVQTVAQMIWENDFSALDDLPDRNRRYRQFGENVMTGPGPVHPDAPTITDIFQMEDATLGDILRNSWRGFGGQPAQEPDPLRRPPLEDWDTWLRQNDPVGRDLDRWFGTNFVQQPGVPELPGQQYVPGGFPTGGVPRLSEGPPMIINNYYTINATSYDDNEMVRKLQSIFDQEAVRLPGRAGD